MTSYIDYVKHSLFVLFLTVFFIGCGNGFQVMQRNPQLKGIEVPIEPSNLDERLHTFIKKLSSDYVGEGVVQETGEKRTPSMVLGVVTPKGKSILTFGLTTKGVPPTTKDIYPVSSITKMLTGLILARGVDEGAYLLPRKLSELLPSDLAPLVGNKTLGQTVSHYASFKSRPMNMNYANKDAPAANYTKDMLATCLASSECSTISKPPGSIYVYSDLGIGLLGHALMNFYKKATYDDLLLDRLTGRFDMKDTSANLERYKGKNVVEGFRTTGELVRPATMGSLVAAGGVLTSGEDMLKLLSELVNPSSQNQNTMRLATTPIKPGIAFAIDVMNIDSMELFSKSGEQAGYSSLIMWNKKTASGVFALANRGMSSKSLAKFLIKIHKQMSEIP